MATGLFLGKKNIYIERFTQQGGELRLLASEEGAEIMHQNIKSGEVCFIEPCESDTTMEFFYILTGKIEIDGPCSSQTLGPGDYLYVYQLTETINFRTVTDVTMLYISTFPQFSFLSTTTKELFDLAEQVKAKDKYTLLHNERVKEYALKIADKLGLSNEQKRNILYASLFHDVGKVDLPTELLNKNGCLTAAEMDLMREHPVIGAEMLTGTHFAEIGEIILQHHERINGTGYPRGLRGDEIMIEAQIIAVADVFDAMTTDRSYRPALPIALAVEEIAMAKGILFGELIVEKLFEILKEDGLL
jgi:putative nucleotidyltransferase with HDIG domain